MAAPASTCVVASSLAISILIGNRALTETESYHSMRFSVGGQEGDADVGTRRLRLSQRHPQAGNQGQKQDHVKTKVEDRPGADTEGDREQP